MDVILEAIQSGASRRVETPTRRKDITPIAQEPDFLDQEDEPEVTLPEGYEESDFDERKKSSDSGPEAEVKADTDAGSDDESTEAVGSVSEESTPQTQNESAEADTPADESA